MRSGRYVQQIEGYRAFVPAPLLSMPRIVMDAELETLLSLADLELGRLDGVTSVLPNPDFFVAMYVRHEAVLSSQIEGTQSTLEDVLEYEINADPENPHDDVVEVVNYVAAMNHGLRRLHEFPLSLPLIQEIHSRLMRDSRGAHREPGEFRRSQNWIGPAGCTLASSTFVPPPPHEMQAALNDFEKFLHRGNDMPPLIHCGLAHAQFETIHPFLDGNGRVGRLLITFLLCHRAILQRPLLYLSLYLKAYRAEYYDRLMAVRLNDDWEGWLKFFLRGVAEVSRSATATARAILSLRVAGPARVPDLKNSMLAQRFFELLFERPMLTSGLVAQNLNCSYVTANKLIERFRCPDLGYLEEITGRQRNRRFCFRPFLALFEDQLVGAVASSLPEVALQTTRSI